MSQTIKLSIAVLLPLVVACGGETKNAQPATNAKSTFDLDRITRITAYLAAPAIDRVETWDRVRSELGDYPNLRFVKIEIRDPDEISRFREFLNHSGSTNPTEPPHGWIALANIDLEDENRTVQHLATNYIYYSINGPGDWRMKDGLYDYLYDLLINGSDKQRRITIELRSNSKGPQQEM